MRYSIATTAYRRDRKQCLDRAQRPMMVKLRSAAGQNRIQVYQHEIHGFGVLCLISMLAGQLKFVCCEAIRSRGIVGNESSELISVLSRPHTIATW